jgi:hypothetical protein
MSKFLDRIAALKMNPATLKVLPSRNDVPVAPRPPRPGTSPKARAIRRKAAEALVQDLISPPADLRRVLTLMSKDVLAASPEGIAQRFHDAIDHPSAPVTDAQRAQIHQELDTALREHIAERNAADGDFLEPREAAPARPVVAAPVNVKVDAHGRRLADVPRKCRPGEIEKIIERDSAGHLIRVVEIRH